MDTSKLQEVIDAANKVIVAANDLMQDAESEGKAQVLAEAMDDAAAVYDETAEELNPTQDEGEEEAPAPIAADIAAAAASAAVTAVLRDAAGLPPTPTAWQYATKRTVYHCRSW